MATQGMISIVDGNAVVMKIVVGCNGYNVDAVCDRISLLDELDPKLIEEICKDQKLGCDGCRVIQTGPIEFRTGVYIEGDLYRDKFNDPNFNPRWDCGLCEYVKVLQLASTS